MFDTGKKEQNAIDKIVVGLGNPGPEYAGTRHNLGYRALDAFLHLIGKRKNFLPGPKSRVQVVKIKRKNVLLVRPTTYMNLSGDALRPLLKKYDLEISDVLVVHDEMDVEFGRAKMRRGGGAAGHKGIKSIIETCGEDFTRIKIGIGVPQDNNENANIDWVLGRPTEAEEAILSELMPKIAEGIKVWINEGSEKAMTLFNTQMKSDNGDDETGKQEENSSIEENKTENDER